MDDLTAGKTAENPSQKPDRFEVEEEKFPVIVFSHGISGNRFIYSTISASIASYGYVVVVIEHRYLFFHFFRVQN
jgi:predicted dienelactone hydrolase